MHISINTYRESRAKGLIFHSNLLIILRVNQCDIKKSWWIGYKLVKSVIRTTRHLVMK